MNLEAIHYLLRRSGYLWRTLSSGYSRFTHIAGNNFPCVAKNHCRSSASNPTPPFNGHCSQEEYLGFILDMLADSGCTRTLIAQGLVDKYGFTYDKS